MATPAVPIAVIKRGGCFIAAAAAVSIVAVVLSIEPMRWNLPLRYMFKPLEIYRRGAIDYTMCMRVELSRTEADNFIRRRFDPGERIARPVPIDQSLCPAPFWPKDFAKPTLGYEEHRRPNGMVRGSTGAVYDRGFIYFWSWER